MKNIAKFAFKTVLYGIGYYVGLRSEVSRIFDYDTPNPSTLLSVDNNVGPFKQGYRSGVNRLRRRVITA